LPAPRAFKYNGAGMTVSTVPTVVAVVAGLLLILVVLVDTFETIVMPARSDGNCG
jgi:hypothetical protein